MPRMVTTVVLLSVSAFADEAPPPGREPQGALTLREAIAAALEHSPALAVYSWDLRIADARIVQAGLRPNPELSVELEGVRIGSSSEKTVRTRTLGIGADGPAAALEYEREATPDVFNEAELTLSLAQTLELGGKRVARVAAAERAREVSVWDYEVARVEVAGEVLVRFTQLLAMQERLRLEESLVEIADQLASSVGALVDAGKVSPLEVQRSGAEANRTRIQRQERARAVEQARVQLGAMWGSNQPVFTKAVGEVSATPPLPPLKSILDKRGEHPASKRWAAELAYRESLLALERKQRVPDLTLRFGYRGTSVDSVSASSFGMGTDGVTASRTDIDTDEWENSVVVEATIPLPLFHRNQGAIREAELTVTRLEDVQQAWEKSLEAALSEKHVAASAAIEKSQGLAEHVLPELERALALTRDGYELGKFDFLRVLDAQRAVIDVRSEILDAQIEYHLAIAGMEQLTGLAIADYESDDGSPTAETRTETDHE